jgi:hypothetical protein
LKEQDSQASLEELWSMVQEQRRRIAQLEGQQRRQRWTRRLGLPAAALVVALVAITPGIAAPSGPVAHVSKGMPSAQVYSSAACSPATLTGDTNNSCTGVTNFTTTSGSTNGGWIFHENQTSGLAVHATCTNGADCWGLEAQGTDLGVSGWSTLAGGSGVQGYNGATSSGYGVYGHVSDTAGAGVYGYNGSSGVGVQGASASGYGGYLSGGLAPLHLVPGTSATPPTNGQAGDLYVDAAGHLWYCKVSVNGSTPATWQELA